MADHYLRAVEHLDEVEQLRKTLRLEYAQGRPDSAKLSRLHQSIGAGLKLAQIHAQLAEVQALRDVGAGAVLSS